MSTFLQILDQMILTAVAGQRAGDVLQTQALRNSIAQMMAEIAEEDAAYAFEEARNLQIRHGMVSPEIVMSEGDAGAEVGIDEGSTARSSVTVTPNDTSYFGSHFRCTPEQTAEETRKLSPVPEDRYSDGTYHSDTSSSVYQHSVSDDIPETDHLSRISSPSTSTHSSINTDGSLPDEVLNCPPIAFMRLHQHLLFELHAFRPKRAKAAPKASTKTRVALGELSNGISPAFLMGRPPKHEGLSPIAACYQEDESVVKEVKMKKFADV